jgi:hypothetical protein
MRFHHAPLKMQPPSSRPPFTGWLTWCGPPFGVLRSPEIPRTFDIELFLLNDHNIIGMSVESYRKHGPVDPRPVRIIETYRTDRYAGYGIDPQGNKAMTYEEKVKLFLSNRYLMPLPPLGTKNWTVRDFVRYIDQHGRWCPDGRDHCDLYRESPLGNLPSSLNWI